MTRSEAPDLVLVEHPARRRGPDGAPVDAAGAPRRRGPRDAEPAASPQCPELRAPASSRGGRGGARRRPVLRGDRDHRGRDARLRRRCRRRRAGRADPGEPRGVAGLPRLGPGGGRGHADHCRGPGLRARWRSGAGHGLRHARRRRRRDLRPARDQPRDHPGCGRHSAPRPCHRQGPGDGARAHGASGRRGGGGAPGFRDPRGAGCGDARRRPRPGGRRCGPAGRGGARRRRCRARRVRGASCGRHSRRA